MAAAAVRKIFLQTVPHSAVYGAFNSVATPLKLGGGYLIVRGGEVANVGAADLNARGYPRDAINASLDAYPDALTSGAAPYIDNYILNPALNAAENLFGVTKDSQTCPYR